MSVSPLFYRRTLCRQLGRRPRCRSRGHGRDGIDHEKFPLSKTGIEIAVEQLAEVCKTDESKLFLDVVDTIK